MRESQPCASSIQPFNATDDSQSIQSCVYCEELLILVTMIDIQSFYDLNSGKVLIVRGS